MALKKCHEFLGLNGKHAEAANLHLNIDFDIILSGWNNSFYRVCSDNRTQELFQFDRYLY